MQGLGELDSITIDCHDPVALAGFWAQVFGTRVQPPDGEPVIYVDLEAKAGVPILRFQKVPESKAVKNRLHLDVSVGDLDEACARAQELGAVRADDREFSEFRYRWRVMLDPEGNEFCLVIRPS